MLNRVSIIKERLIDKFQLNGLPETELQEILSKIEKGLSYRAGVTILESLSEGDRDTFLGMIDNSPEGEVLAWLKSKIPDFDQLIDRLVEDHCDEIGQLLES